jgi:hypothetical protein
MLILKNRRLLGSMFRQGPKQLKCSSVVKYFTNAPYPNPFHRERPLQLHTLKVGCDEAIKWMEVENQYKEVSVGVEFGIIRKITQQDGTSPILSVRHLRRLRAVEVEHTDFAEEWRLDPDCYLMACMGCHRSTNQNSSHCMMEVAAKDVNSAEVTEFANLVVSTVRAWNKSRVDSNLIYRVNGDYMTWEKEKSVVHPVLPLPFRITKMVPKPFASHTNVTDLPDVTEKVSKVSSPPNPHGTYKDGSRLRNGSMGCGIVVGSKEDYAVSGLPDPRGAS